ncbi:hypothetical protein [Streptomyces albus]|uniref:hypothetical protein n=1 Tax=Streptomyces albus TaxID=1888 RepID=UPI0034549332
MAERTPRSLTLVRHIRWKLHLIGHHDAAHSTFLAGTWRTSNAEDRAQALAQLAWDARDHPLPHSAPGPARTLATHLHRAAREHDDRDGPFTITPAETTDPLVQMRAAVLLVHAALRNDCWDDATKAGRHQPPTGTGSKQQ